MSFRARIGNFCLMVGITLVLLFVYTDAVGSPYFTYILLGIFLILFGMFLRWVSPSQPAPPSNRFRVLKARPKKPKEKDHDDEE